MGLILACRLNWLNENGHAELVRFAIAVINAVREEGPHLMVTALTCPNSPSAYLIWVRDR